MNRPRRDFALPHVRYRTVSLASALAAGAVVRYGDEAMTTTRFSRTVALGGVAAATFLIATTITAFRVYYAHTAWIDASRSAAYVSTGAFAEAAESWLLRHQQETVRRVADVMVSGPYRYIEVVVEGDPVLAVGDGTQLDHGSVPPESGTPEEGRASLQRQESQWILDVSVPFASLDGYARTAQDVTASRAVVIGAGLRIGAACFGAWSVLSALTWGIGRRIRRGEGAIRPVGESYLEIDPRTKSVRLNGTSVRLSPNQFALLSLLSSEEGRVFSDEDILLAVWPESRYADSNDIRQCVYQLRRRLEAARPGSARHVYNEKGFGYCFVSNLSAGSGSATPQGKKESQDVCSAP